MTTTTFTTTGFGSFFAGLRSALADRSRKALAYNRTYRALSDMTDRELADIGITRFMIADVAAEAAAQA